MIQRGQVFIRAKTSDDRWASVDVLDLDEESFKRFVLTKLVEFGYVCAVGLTKDAQEIPYTTPLTKEEAE